MRISVIMSAALMLCAAASCGNGGNGMRRHGAEIDREAYNLGCDHAKLVVDALPDTAAVCGLLIDIRTRESDFRKRFGNPTADAYVSGFEHTVREKSPSLAGEIF